VPLLRRVATLRASLRSVLRTLRPSRRLTQKLSARGKPISIGPFRAETLHATSLHAYGISLFTKPHRGDIYTKKSHTYGIWLNFYSVFLPKGGQVTTGLYGTILAQGATPSGSYNYARWGFYKHLNPSGSGVALCGGCCYEDVAPRGLFLWGLPWAVSFCVSRL
jgi:hypothetical protein